MLPHDGPILRTIELLELGDAARAKELRDGQRVSETFGSSFAIDVMLYSSRSTAAECVAVYDRAIGGRWPTLRLSN